MLPSQITHKHIVRKMMWYNPRQRQHIKVFTRNGLNHARCPICNQETRIVVQTVCTGWQIMCRYCKYFMYSNWTDPIIIHHPPKKGKAGKQLIYLYDAPSETLPFGDDSATTTETQSKKVDYARLEELDL